jgi:hypothetical protein
MSLRLSEVTLCAVDCATTALAERALRRSMAQCSFGDAILFSDQVLAPAPFRCVRIDKVASKAEYSRFILKELPQFVRTAFVLIVQWDGYVLDAGAWSPEFMHFDLIGAVWPWHKDGMTVGNGGFSLRSRKLLEVTSASSFTCLAEVNEDEQICRVHRTQLMQQHGIRFAPESVAHRFSYERSLPSLPTFGFHGLFNLWRHVDDEELPAIARGFTAQVARSIEFLELFMQYFRMRKFGPLRGLYRRWKELCPMDEIRAQLAKAAQAPGAADYFIRLCELPIGYSGATTEP